MKLTDVELEMLIEARSPRFGVCRMNRTIDEILDEVFALVFGRDW